MNHTLINQTELDGLVKFVLAIVVAVLPFYFQQHISYGLFMLYVLIITRVLRIPCRALLLSAASYCLIVLIPYLFGISINILLLYLTQNPAFISYQQIPELILRMFRLLVIWYVSMLYIYTTPMPIFLGLLDKLLWPLKLLKVPVQDYLKVVMCVVMDLKSSGEDVKTRFLDRARSAMGGGSKRLKVRLGGIAQLIAATLVESFQKLDSIEAVLEKTSAEDMFHYHFKVTRLEGMAVLSISLLTIVLYFIEKGNGFII